MHYNFTAKLFTNYFSLILYHKSFSWYLVRLHFFLPHFHQNIRLNKNQNLLIAISKSFQAQHKDFDGKCGICGDPYEGYQPHQVPGKYATGIIGRSYFEPGQVSYS